MKLLKILRKAWKDERTEQSLRDSQEVLVQIHHINNDSKACFGDDEGWLREHKEGKIGDK